MHDKLFMAIVHVVLILVLTTVLTIVLSCDAPALTRWLVAVPLFIADFLAVIGVIYQIKR